MWTFLPAHLLPFLHTTAYPVPPFSSRDPTVQSTSPGWESALLASCSAHYASAMETLTSSSVGPSSCRYTSSTRLECSLKWTMRCPMGVLPPGRDLAWFPLAMTSVSARGVDFCYSVGSPPGVVPTLPSRPPDLSSGSFPSPPAPPGFPTSGARRTGSSPPRLPVVPPQFGPI